MERTGLDWRIPESKSRMKTQSGKKQQKGIIMKPNSSLIETREITSSDKTMGVNCQNLHM